MSFDACAAAVQKGDPDRFAAAMTAPVASRGGLLAIYGFNLEIARAPWVTAEPMIALMRLQWWRDALDEIYAGGAVRRHEVVEPLAMTIRESRLERADFDRMIDGRAWEVEIGQSASESELFDYLDQTGTAILQAGAAHLGVRRDLAPIGRAFGLAGLIRAHGALVGVGKCRLPTDSEAERQQILNGDVPEGFAARLSDIAGKALDDLRSARAGNGMIAAAPALRSGWKAQDLLRQAADDPKAALLTPVAPSAFGASVRLAWLSIRNRW